MIIRLRSGDSLPQGTTGKIVLREQSYRGSTIVEYFSAGGFCLAFVLGMLLMRVCIDERLTIAAVSHERALGDLRVDVEGAYHDGVAECRRETSLGKGAL